MQSGYDMKHLFGEAHNRWLKPVEVYAILQSYEENQLAHQVPQKPASGSLFLFNKRVLKYFRKDGHRWRRRKDQRTIAEAHERLKVGSVEALNCYYAHGEENPNFQRRSYWMLDPFWLYQGVRAHCSCTLQRYWEGRQNTRSTSQFPTLSSSTFSPSPTSFITNQPESSLVIGESYELYNNQSSPSYAEISSNDIMTSHGMNQLDLGDRSIEMNNSSGPDLNQALRRIEQQLSLNDDEVKDFNPFCIDTDDSNDLEDALREYGWSGQTSNGSENFLLQQHSDDRILQHDQLPGIEADIWKDMVDITKNFQIVGSQAQLGGSNQNSYSSLFDQAESGISLDTSLTISEKQKFTIRDISPDWCYTSEGAKILIIGSFLCNASECAWACMFGATEVPVQIIQEGVLSCRAPPHLHGKVTLCITSGNRESCSEVRDFEYRAKPSTYAQSNVPESETGKSSEELLLLVRFVQMLLSDWLTKKDNPETRVDLLGKSRIDEEPWGQIIDAVLVGASTSSSTLDWLMQELLKNKLEAWLSSRLQDNDQKGCSLSRKEQGILHMVAGLGLEWALQPILDSGVSVNYRDINGWTALHWAARFGREKMVAALIASGASAGAVTDPNSRDPNGKTPASIAATCGHKGLAGYLSEFALTSHLSSLTLEESEISKGSAAVEAERTVNSLSRESPSLNEDHVSLKYTLAAVRNAAQAAARIQSAFRAHSFRKRQQREATLSIAGNSGDEYGILADNIQGLSVASQLVFGNSRNCNTAALSIQKKYRGWKGRKDFLTLRQKVVKIQAHVRGYQVRKHYHVCWAVSMLEKVVLRWRRHGVGLRGFRPDSESIDEKEDEDVLRVFRKQKVDAAIDEAVSRVLSMVESSEARQQYRRLLEKYRQAKAEQRQV